MVFFSDSVVPTDQDPYLVTSFPATPIGPAGVSTTATCNLTLI